MSDGPGLILFMGRRTEHADVSIQRYVPEVVHIVTSEELREDSQIHLERWSSMYDVRAGGVKSVDDLFESTAVGSLLNAVAEIRTKENDDGPKKWYVGLTGGTMHMAATAVYASILMDMQPFYVIQPPMGLEQMPNRDVLEFPAFNGMKAVLELMPPHLRAIASGEGTVKELAESDMPEWMFIRLRQSGVIDVDNEKGIWKTTPSGITITEFANTPLQMFFNKMEEEILNSQDDEEPDLGYIV
tara:strand:+ start:493 stop:1221 length:729 start_codon:yes stop_codon:yes gene_type:complete